jgi:hypothetical protein
MKKQVRNAQGILVDVLRKVPPLSGVAEIRMPSDLKRVLVSNIENLRENAVEIFAREISHVLAKVDFQNIIDDLVKNYTVRVEARIDLLPKRAKQSPRRRKK